jgi:hypothetical protein
MPLPSSPLLPLCSMLLLLLHTGVATMAAGTAAPSIPAPVRLQSSRAQVPLLPTRLCLRLALSFALSIALLSMAVPSAMAAVQSLPRPPLFLASSLPQPKMTTPSRSSSPAVHTQLFPWASPLLLRPRCGSRCHRCRCSRGRVATCHLGPSRDCQRVRPTMEILPRHSIAVGKHHDGRNRRFPELPCSDFTARDLVR